MADQATTIDTLDRLTPYTANAPDYIDTASKYVQQYAGGTTAGDAVQQGLAGAATGIATGVGVGATIAESTVVVTALATVGIAAQAIPVIGTIAGAVVGLIAGLVAFFTGKHKANAAQDAKDEAQFQKEFAELTNRIQQALSILPNTAWRDQAVQLLHDRIANAPFTTPAEYAGNIYEAIFGYPDALSEAVAKWTKQLAANMQGFRVEPGQSFDVFKKPHVASSAPSASGGAVAIGAGAVGLGLLAWIFL